MDRGTKRCISEPKQCEWKALQRHMSQMRNVINYFCNMIAVNMRNEWLNCKRDKVQNELETNFQTHVSQVRQRYMGNT